MTNDVTDIPTGDRKTPCGSTELYERGECGWPFCDCPEQTSTDTAPDDWAACAKCGAMRFYPSGRCMQGCDGYIKQSPDTIKE